MQADEQARLHLVGELHAIGQRHAFVCRARKVHPPAFALQQRLQPPRPVQRIFLFKFLVEHTARAAVVTAVPGINHGNPSKTRRARRQRREMLLDVEVMYKKMPINYLRPESHPDLHPLASNQPPPRSEVEAHAGDDEAVKGVATFLDASVPAAVEFAPAFEGNPFHAAVGDTVRRRRGLGVDECFAAQHDWLSGRRYGAWRLNRRGEAGWIGRDVARRFGAGDGG